MPYIIQNKTLLCGAAGLLALGLGTNSSASVMTFGDIEAEFHGTACPGVCVDLASAGYNASGGAVIDPAQTVQGVHKTPGEDTGNSGNVTSYNVTSQNDDPEGAASTISVTDLDGLFSLYWGSIDGYNQIEFFGDNVVSVAGNSTNSLQLITGEDIYALHDDDDGSPDNFNTDGYFSFSGEFDRVELTSAEGVAFELATASSVPEPGTLGLLGLGLLGLGAGRKRLADR